MPKWVEKILKYNPGEKPLTLFRMGGGGGAKKPPYQFFPCNFYKRRN